MADCAYTFTGPDGKPLTIVGVPGLKAYLVDGGLEHLFPERKFPLKAVARFSREGIGATINVDGVERPTTNSTGQLIHQTEDGIRNFWKWFGDSKVVDSEGRPLVVYHGTKADFSEFKKGDVGFHLGTKPQAESIIKRLEYAEGEPKVIPAYLRIENLVRLPDIGFGVPGQTVSSLQEEGYITKEQAKNIRDEMAIAYIDKGTLKAKQEALRNELLKLGIDGIIYLNTGEPNTEFEKGDARRYDDSFIALSPNQIKSAIGNQGSFSPEDTDIRYSKSEKPTRKNTFQNQAEAEEHLLQSFGSGIKNLIASNVLNFTQGKAGWPKGLKLSGGEEAVYVNGKAYIDLQAIGKERLDAVVLHEIGEHFNLKWMLGEDGYRSLQDQITNQAKIKGSATERTWARVKNLYPDLEVGSEEFVAEVIAKLGEENPKAPWYRRLLTRIKTFLVARGLAKGFSIGTFTEADMHDLLRTSLMSAAGRYAKGEARFFGEMSSEGSLDAQPQFSIAPEERSSLWNRWFGKSKMQRGGQPIKFYHGSQNEFTVFDKNRLATATSHSTAGLGHFFTMDKGEALGYGNKVKEVFLSIQKPYVTFSWSMDNKFSDSEGAARFREKLISEGYDGVFIKDAGYAVTFEPNQAKLTSNEKPSFGEDVRFSRVGTVADDETYEEAFWRDNQPSVMQLMKEKMEDATDAARKIMLAGLGVNHMIEIMANPLPTLKALGRSIQLRETAKMDIIRDADGIVVDAKDKLDGVTRSRLNRVINESTDVDVDASLAWSGIESSEGKGSGATVFTVHTQANLSENYRNAANLAAIALGLKPSEATGKAFIRNRASFLDKAKADAFLAELQKIEQRQIADRANAKLNATNQKRKVEHAKLRSVLSALGDEPVRLYRAMNDQHTNVMEQQLEEITTRIENAISDHRLRSEMIANTRKAFEDNSLQWYYAPLTRFGDYWFYGTMEKDGEIEHWREHFNSEKALNRKIALFEKKGGKLIGRGKRLQNIEQFGSIGAADSYVADIQAKIAQHLDVNDPATQQLQDAIYQYHLSTLPDVSIRHSRQHRKGVKGAEADAFKSFSDKMHHASTQLANMKYGAEIAEIMTDHQEMKKLWENSNYLKAAENRIEAIQMLQDGWDTLAKPGVLEKLMDQAEIDSDFAKLGVYKEAINVRNKFGGAVRDQFDKDGKLIGQIGSEGYEVEEGLARLKARTEKHVTGAKRIQDKDKTLAADVIDELLKSVDAMMKTQTTDMDRWAMKLSALNFTGMMGFGVSSALVNIVQTPGVAAPVIGARYGFAKTMATLNKTASWFLKAAFSGLKDEDGNISITGYLLAEHAKAEAAKDYTKATEIMAIHDALDTFKKDGTIGRTQTFDLLGVAQDGLGTSSILFDIAKKGGFMFHHAERFNREVTLAAAYILSKNDTARTPRQQGESDRVYKNRVNEAAIDYARWANERAHLNYSAEVAARIFRGPLARISMQFRKYTHGMMFLWGKSLHDMLATVKKEDFPDEKSWEAAKEAKLEARRTFLGLLFMQTSFAGAMGLPMMGTIGIAYSLLAGDDDDIPADLERDLTAILIKWFGEDVGYGLARGFIDKATPVALSTRLDLKDIYFREPLKEMEGRDEGAAYALQVLGPTGGSFLNMWQGLSDAARGDVLKGGEKVLPKAIGDIVKAYRLGTEGATTRQGDHIKDMKGMEVFLQSIGFGSSELQRYYAESGFAKSAEDSLEKVRQSTVSKIGRAMATGGEVDMDSVDEWNEKHPEWPIRYQDLVASSKRVTSNIEERAEKGYLLNPKLEYLREEYDFFSEDDED